MTQMTDDIEEPASARLHRIGVTFDHLHALEQIWNQSEAFRLIVDESSGSLAGHGYSALDSLDAIWHELDAPIAHLYMQHGFTPHQAFLLNDNRPAQRYLWGPDADAEQVHELLDVQMSRSLFVKALLVAESSQEIDALICAMTLDGAHPETFNPGPTVAQVEARASSLPVDVDICDCDF